VVAMAGATARPGGGGPAAGARPAHSVAGRGSWRGDQDAAAHAGHQVVDVAVDGADAFIVTTAERARDLALPPVLINAAVLGQVRHNEEDQTVSLREHGQQVVVDTLKAKSDFWIDDIDIYFPYDGFTPITLNWIDNAGWCKPGEAGAFLREHWVAERGWALINGRIPVNPHGGSLSEGATQASGHIREAVHQLQGVAGDRQVTDARRALITAGGFFFNAQGLTLHRA